MGCNNSIVVNAPVDKVWNAIKNFHDLSWAPNVITKLDVVGDKSGNEIGAGRILNDAFHETLRSIDEANKTFTYSIDDGPAAVSKDNVKGYLGKVKVFEVTADGSTFVSWTSEWDSDESGGVADFCNPVYHALLHDMQAFFA